MRMFLYSLLYIMRYNSSGNSLLEKMRWSDFVCRLSLARMDGFPAFEANKLQKFEHKMLHQGARKMLMKVSAQPDITFPPFRRQPTCQRDLPATQSIVSWPYFLDKKDIEGILQRLFISFIRWENLVH